MCASCVPFLQSLELSGSVTVNQLQLNDLLHRFHPQLQPWAPSQLSGHFYFLSERVSFISRRPTSFIFCHFECHKKRGSVDRLPVLQTKGWQFEACRTFLRKCAWEGENCILHILYLFRSIIFLVEMLHQMSLNLKSERYCLFLTTKYIFVIWLLLIYKSGQIKYVLYLLIFFSGEAETEK